MPRLVQLNTKYGTKGLRVVGLTPAAESAAAEFAGAHGVTYPLLAAAQQEQTAYGVRWFPAVFLVDPAGRVVSQDLHDIEEIVAREL